MGSGRSKNKSCPKQQVINKCLPPSNNQSCLPPCPPCLPSFQFFPPCPPFFSQPILPPCPPCLPNFPSCPPNFPPCPPILPPCPPILPPCPPPQMNFMHCPTPSFNLPQFLQSSSPFECIPQSQIQCTISPVPNGNMSFSNLSVFNRSCW
jgi:hypothetical protein